MILRGDFCCLLTLLPSFTIMSFTSLRVRIVLSRVGRLIRSLLKILPIFNILIGHGSLSIRRGIIRHCLRIAAFLQVVLL